MEPTRESGEQKSEEKAATGHHDNIVLSARDFARFAPLIGTPEPPTPGLWAAMAECERLKEARPESDF